MKKGAILGLIIISILIISMSFASASWLGDVWGKITGKSIITGDATRTYCVWGGQQKAFGTKVIDPTTGACKVCSSATSTWTVTAASNCAGMSASSAPASTTASSSGLIANLFRAVATAANTAVRSAANNTVTNTPTTIPATSTSTASSGGLLGNFFRAVATAANTAVRAAANGTILSSVGVSPNPNLGIPVCTVRSDGAPWIVSGITSQSYNCQAGSCKSIGGEMWGRVREAGRFTQCTGFIDSAENNANSGCCSHYIPGLGANGLDYTINGGITPVCANGFTPKGYSNTNPKYQCVVSSSRFKFTDVELANIIPTVNSNNAKLMSAVQQQAASLEQQQKASAQASYQQRMQALGIISRLVSMCVMCCDPNWSCSSSQLTRSWGAECIQGYPQAVALYNQYVQKYGSEDYSMAMASSMGRDLSKYKTCLGL